MALMCLRTLKKLQILVIQQKSKYVSVLFWRRKIGTVDLTYKTFRFFGPENTITAPLILNSDVNYYKNTYNDAYSTFLILGKKRMYGN